MRQKKVSKEEKNKTKTTFTLLFPTLIIAAIAVGSTTNVWLSILTIGLTIYEFALTNQFIDQYYHLRY